MDNCKNLAFKTLFFSGGLAGLQSVAAVLGAISFGVFVGLMLCSVLYKRWTRGRGNGNQVNIEADEDDYDDVIQRAAPPSYNKGTFTPKEKSHGI